MIEINTAPAAPVAPGRYARKVFVNLLLVGALAMIVLLYTDIQSGLSTPWDRVALPVLAAATITSAGLIMWRGRWMNRVLGVNGLLLIVYYQGVLYQAIKAHDAVSIYSVASMAQFLPAFYVALFVLLARDAAIISWIIYASIAALCILGIVDSMAHNRAEVERQMYFSILFAHPCYILLMSFMNHLRRLIEDAQRESISAKERFLAMVSHEVRSPLQTILSSLDLLEVSPTGPMAAKAIGRVKGATAILESQIRDLTSFTRLELDPNLQTGPVDLPRLLQGVCETYLHAASLRGIELKLDIGPSLGKVLADEARLRQVLENLVNNAIKYTTSGWICIGCETQAQGQTRLWVQDTGRGIPADRLTHVFEPFVRVKLQPEERIEGSGLGLAVVRQLVGLMKGTLEIDSVLGQGTIIQMTLPLPQVPAQGVPASLPARILLVDDDPDILSAVGDLLRGVGVGEVLTASDGRGAVSLGLEQVFDVILLDLQIPHASGYEVAKLLRQEGANIDTPFIAMSAIPLDRALPGASAFDGYLPKPVLKQRLINEILLVCARAATPRASALA